MDKKTKIPTTLDESIDCLRALELMYRDMHKCSEIPEDLMTSSTINISNIHRYIRNHWELWTGGELAQWFYTKEIYHPDDMSGIIIDSYNRVIKGKPIDLDKLIKKYHNYWQGVYGDKHLTIMRSQISENITKMRHDRIEKIINNKETNV